MIREELALAVDPGTRRCGVALLSREGEIAWRGVVPREALPERLRELIATYQPAHFLIGDGTGSRSLRAELKAFIRIEFEAVDERYTSEEARRRYVTEKPAVGWSRLLPRSLRTPDQPYDDYVALILAERFWKSRKAEE